MPRFLALALIGACACSAQRTDRADPPELQLRTYKVPPGSGQQLRGLLHGVLFLEKDKSVGRVSVSPDGQLVVLGSPQVQKGVEQLVADFPAVRRTPATIQIEYWLLRGRPGPGKDAPELQAIAPAVKAIAGQGASQLEPIESLRLQTLSDEYGKIQGRTLEVQQTASLVDGKVVADLRLSRHHGNGRLETRLQLQPGQLVVLGESGEGEEPGSSLYYVVRASPVAEGK
jgi:hypothetical protein